MSDIYELKPYDFVHDTARDEHGSILFLPDDEKAVVAYIKDNYCISGIDVAGLSDLEPVQDVDYSVRIIFQSNKRQIDNIITMKYPINTKVWVVDDKIYAGRVMAYTPLYIYVIFDNDEYGGYSYKCVFDNEDEAEASLAAKDIS